MTVRIADTVRQPQIRFLLDGQEMVAHPGETIAGAMLAADHPAFRRDCGDRPRGLWCNMGTCCECMVTLDPGSAKARRVRACLVEVQAGQRVATCR